ncbi:MAG: two-component system response regulator [Hydrogenophilales bacterium 17-61-76]|nr:MAG: two-component system response regulator [Hydrogenophilales bacterium 17-61-76]
MSSNPIDSPPTAHSVSPFPVHSRLLLVDDEPLILEGLSRLLTARNYDVVTANGGRAALVAIGKQQFDVILLDLGMPDLNGNEVLRFIADRGIDTPVIVVSGESAIDAAIRALRGGATDFVRKPYEPEELLRRIDNTLIQRRLERENNHILQRLQQSEKWHRFLVNSSPDFIYTLDVEGRFTFVNDRVESLLGYRRDDLLGQHYSLLVHEDDLGRAEHIFNERRAGDRSVRNQEIRLKCNPGMRRPRLMNGLCKSVELTATGMYDEQASAFEQRFIGSYGVAKDVTERKQAEETVHYQAYHDLLTGLPNRALFRDHLGLMLAQARRNQQPLAVLSLDLDHFKVINDSLGHTVGDELLLAVSARLRQCLREGDTLARLGGDEFAVLLPTLVSRSDVEHICRKITQALSKPVHVKGHEVYISVSIGACVTPEDGEMIDSLIRDLRRALVHNEFVLFYQPQVDALSGEVRGFEALLRWWHPQRGMLSPGEFIPVAEEAGIIVPIGDWVLNQTCAQIAAWRAAGLPPVRVSINISARQLETPDFVETVMRALQVYSLDGKQLELEITESLLMRDFESNAIKLGRLSASGIRLAIDDFVSIVNAMVAMGRGMHLNVIAEGVESEAQLLRLQQMQCHEIQGYYYSPPVSAHEASELLSHSMRGFARGDRLATG